MKKYKDFFTPVAILAAGVMVSLSILTVGGVDILKQGLPAQAGAGSEAEAEELRQALADYGDQVRWVYKHFPLDALHPKADKEAEAVECAGELGGDEKFWAYMDRIFEVTPSNNGLDLALLPQIAKDLGLDQKAFENCLSSGKYAEKVEKQYQEGVRLGINGTPGSFVNATPVQGAIPYENLKAIIEAEIQKL